jgi:hypothetical protein
LQIMPINIHKYSYTYNYKNTSPFILCTEVLFSHMQTKILPKMPTQHERFIRPALGDLKVRICIWYVL